MVELWSDKMVEWCGVEWWSGGGWRGGLVEWCNGVVAKEWTGGVVECSNGVVGE